MRLERLAQILGVGGGFVLEVLLMIGCSGGPASMTPINPVLRVPSASGPTVTVQPNVPLHFPALPLLNMNGTFITFNAPWPTGLHAVVFDPASGASVSLPVITASESPPTTTATTGFARTDNVNSNSSPALWTVTVRPPDSFYALGTFNIRLSVVSLNSAFTGAQHESPPLDLILQTFRVNVTITSGGGGVVSNPAGIDCGRGNTACTQNFPPSTGNPIMLVTLIPEIISRDAQTCFKFQGWTGPCSGSGSCPLPLDGTKTMNVAASFDAGQACAGLPAICATPGQSTPLCPASAVNSSGIALCDSGGWFCCSTAVPDKPGSGCVSGSGPAYGAVQCTSGTPSNRGCQ